MAIIINIDLMLAKRKMSVTELAVKESQNRSPDPDFFGQPPPIPGNPFS
jgi:hypothetical protein